MADDPDEHPYKPGVVLTDLAVDRRHRVRLPGWGLVELTIHTGEPVHVPDPVTPMPPDDEDWRLERLDFSHD